MHAVRIGLVGWLYCFARRLSIAPLVVAFAFASLASANVFFGPVLDPNDGGFGFSPTNPDFIVVGQFDIDDTFVDPVDSNDVARFSSGFQQFGVHVATMGVHISNGENGNDGDDPFNPDVFNFEPPHSEFAVINAPDNRLQNGNVIRYSFWIKADPNFPIISAPTIEPVVSIEFWTEALSNDVDDTIAPNPQFGDRVFDTQINGNEGVYIDINNDGEVNGHPNPGTPGDYVLNSNDWVLVSAKYEVNHAGWGYDLVGGFASKTVDDVEEIRFELTMREFFNTDLTDGGAFFIDQPMVEIYGSMADVPVAIPNPIPGGASVDADFDNDQIVGCQDVNALVAAIVAQDQGTLPLFDLTGDGVLDEEDLDEWLVQAGEINLASQNPYIKGDANLDGVVDDIDFDIWASNRFTTTPAYCLGDFNASGSVDLRDLHIWNENKYLNSDDLNQVPEPRLLFPLLLLVPLVVGRSRAR